MNNDINFGITIIDDNSTELFENIKDYLQKIQDSNNGIVKEIHKLNKMSIEHLNFNIYNFEITENNSMLLFSKELEMYIKNKFLTLLNNKGIYHFHEFVTEINEILDKYVRNLQLTYEYEKYNIDEKLINDQYEKDSIEKCKKYSKTSYVSVSLPLTDHINLKTHNILKHDNKIILTISRDYTYNYSTYRLTFEIFLEFQNTQDTEKAILYLISNRYLQEM